ncbi:hypothetical protein [Arcticibacter pallidicorallinus]
MALGRSVRKVSVIEADCRVTGNPCRLYAENGCSGSVRLW